MSDVVKTSETWKASSCPNRNCFGLLVKRITCNCACVEGTQRANRQGTSPGIPDELLALADEIIK